MNTEETPQPEQPKSLVAKLSEVMAAIDRIPKTGENSFFHYKYVTEADLTAAVRPELASRGIMMIPTVGKHTRTERTNQKGNPSFITDVEVIWTITDGGQQTIQMMIPGCSEDSSDKGLYKAITGSEKYALKNLFLIPTGDDPENDANSAPPHNAGLPQPPARYQEAKQAQQAAQQAAQSASVSDSDVTGILGEVRTSQDGKAWFLKIGSTEGVWTRDQELALSLLKAQGQPIIAHLRSKKPGSYQLISFVPGDPQ